MLALLLLAGAARGGVLHVPADFPTVAAALAAAVPGDEIVLAAGNYNEPLALENVTDLVLRGQGKVVLSGGEPGLATLSLDDCERITLENLRIEGVPGHGVVVTECEDITLSRLRLADVGGSGILAGDESERLLIDRCDVDGAVQQGMALGLVADVTISRCTVTGTGSHGISLSEAFDSSVAGCRVTGAGGHGIALGPFVAVEGCDVRLNVVVDAAQDGVLVSGSDNVVLDNRIDGAGVVGVRLAAGSQGGVVQGNRIRAAGTGLLSQGVDALLRDNDVREAELRGFVSEGDRCTIVGNRVRRSGSEAFVIGNSVEGGTLLGCRALDAGENGFEIAGNFLSVIDNTSVGAAQIGFEITGADGLITGNAARKSGTLEAEILGAGNVLFDNDF